MFYFAVRTSTLPGRLRLHFLSDLLDLSWVFRGFCTSLDVKPGFFHYIFACQGQFDKSRPGCADLSRRPDLGMTLALFYFVFTRNRWSPDTLGVVTFWSYSSRKTTSSCWSSNRQIEARGDGIIRRYVSSKLFLSAVWLQPQNKNNHHISGEPKVRSWGTCHRQRVRAVRAASYSADRLVYGVISNLWLSAVYWVKFETSA